MEKIIKIDGRDIKFKSTAATPLKYKAQFKTDFFADLIKLSNYLILLIIFLKIPKILINLIVKIAFIVKKLA